MKIYRLKLNADNFQHFLPDEEGIWKTNRLSFDCTKRAAEWVPPKVYIYNPTLEKGNFFALGVNGGTVILDKHAKEQLGVLLRMAGELLPIYYEDEEYAVLNVTESYSLNSPTNLRDPDVTNPLVAACAVGAGEMGLHS